MVAAPADRDPPGPPRLRAALLRLGLSRDIDLALHLPLRYEDETRVVALGVAGQPGGPMDGDTIQFEATVTRCEVTYRPRRQLLVVVTDAAGAHCTLRFFNFYPSHQKSLAPGRRVRVRGELRGGGLGLGGWTMLHPGFRSADEPLPLGLTPVYPATAGIAQPALRRAVHAALARVLLTETIPDSMQIDVLRAWSLGRSLHFLHQPPPGTDLDPLEARAHPAWQRLKHEELLAQQLAHWQARAHRRAQRGVALVPAGQDGGAPAGLGRRLLERLPFALTAAQRRVVAEIETDLGRALPMHRLLQGDVGSGKTVVAALAAAHVIACGWQCALMAPTEILAEQHFRKLVDWLVPLLAPQGLGVAWLAGSQGRRERQAMLAQAADGRAALVIGTHALLQGRVAFARLGLVIIDEQHRFGVAQRLSLRGKGGAAAEGGPSVEAGAAAAPEPHLLMMSATPIPRTLAMSYYADLDVSTLDELPPGRTPVLTRVVSERRRDEVVERMRQQIAQGRQVYWVCPLIEASEALDLTNAQATHADLCAALPGVMVGLLHSRMPAAEKKAVMSLFEEGQMAVLVSTTVIEVGVDVPNATLMVIEHAERFGLSQLHQLRGRVGRGHTASACVLLYATPDGARLGEAARARLQAMAETNDGFEIARRDLHIRGPGEFMGERQSGAPLLRFADLEQDGDILEWARAAAPRIWAQQPDLAQMHLDRWLGARRDYLDA